LPSVARMLYTPCFNEHDGVRFRAYLKDVAEGKSKMNISLIYPYQLYDALRVCTIPEDQLDVMWNQLVKDTREKLIKVGATRQALAVADVSGSMGGVPMSNSIALSLLWAELCEGPFNGHFYSFSETPQLISVKNAKTFKEKVDIVANSKWGMNTNLQAVFDDMLNHISMWKVPNEQCPQTIYIFTDGQFDSMVSNSDMTHLQVIENKYAKAGLVMPRIVFWNLRGDTVDFPSPGDKKNVIMLSGFSPSLMKLVMEGPDVTPMKILMNAISDPIFDCIKLQTPWCTTGDVVVSVRNRPPQAPF